MRRHLAYAAGAAVLALAGCGGDDPTPQVADPTPTASVSASPSASAAVEKEAWEKKTDDGAVAFVEHWLEVFNEAETTGETQVLEDLSAPGCETCANFVEITNDIYGAGGFIKSEGWKIQQVGRPTETATETVVAFNVDQTPQRVRQTAESETLARPGGKLSLSAHLAWRGGKWVMNRLDRVA
ncbi:DUF6318 family protein [Nocardioides salarius]|uniref:DUF6318 family protein n=1 Tax=Nocardioides salarius TaxID=374513 RepID=UPI0030FC3514